MAAGSAARDPMEDLCEEVTCSICQEFFKDPVMLECEHNFCRTCLTQDWAASGTTETSCPQCKENVLQSNLRPNHLLARFVEIAKKCNLQRTKREEGSERICGKHQKQDDETLICKQSNNSKELKDLRAIPLGPAAQDYKVGVTASSAAKDPMEEETACSVCLEYFKDPVSFKCGHNFCRSCLFQRWEKSIAKETSCLLCKEKVPQKYFRPHQQLSNIAETTKKLSLQKTKAKGREGVCEKHRETIILFGKTDETSICEECVRSKEHKGHRVIPLRTAFKDHMDLKEEKEKLLIYKTEKAKEAQESLKLRKIIEGRRMILQLEEQHQTVLQQQQQLALLLQQQQEQLQAQMKELLQTQMEEKKEQISSKNARDRASDPE